MYVFETDEMDNFPWEAVEVLNDILEENKGKYPNGFWRTLSIEEHTSKGIKHGKDFLYDVKSDEDSLAHAFVRLAMAVAVREQKKAGK